MQQWQFNVFMLAQLENDYISCNGARLINIMRFGRVRDRDQKPLDRNNYAIRDF